MERMRRRWKDCGLVVPFLVGLAACVTIPQTTREFREAARGSRVATVEAREIPRPVAQVFRDLRARGDRCFNVTITRIAHSNIPGDNTTHEVPVQFLSTTTMTSDRAGELEIRVAQRGVERYAVPQGGNFVQLVDFEAVGAGLTRVTWTGTTAYGDTLEAVLAWAQGRSADCPKMK